MKQLIQQAPQRALLLGIVLLGLVAALAGGTVAFFSSQASVTGNTFAAGTLDLALTQQQGGSSPQSEQSAQWDFTNMAPGGDEATSSVWIRNTGTIEGATLGLSGDFSNDGSSPSQIAIAQQMRITELTLDGENLLEGGAGVREREYEGPNVSQCDVLVGSSNDADETTIQAGLNAASANDVVCVESGTYTEALEMMTDGVILISLEGPSSTIIDADEATNGIAIGDFDSSGTHPDGVRVQGFTVENWGERGVAQRNGDGTVFVYDNVIEGPTSGNAVRGGVILSGGTGSEVIGNTITTPTFGSPNWSGSGIQLLGTNEAVVTDNYVQGVDIGIFVGGYPDWSSIDPTWATSRDSVIQHNTVTGASSGVALAGDVDDTTIELNAIEDNARGVNQYEQLGGVPGNNNVVTQNNLVDNDVAVRNNAENTTLVAQNNWWGSFTPETSGSGDVDSDNFAGGPFLGLVAGQDPNGNGYADLDDLRQIDITGITPGLDPYDSSLENDKEFVMSVQLDGPTTGNEFQGASLNEYNVEFSLEQI